MFWVKEATGMRPDEVVPGAQDGDARAVFADRIAFLFRLGRWPLFLPFSALGAGAIAAAAPRWTVAIPLLLQTAAAAASVLLARAYAARDRSQDVHIWAQRYTLCAAAIGAAWGAGALLWFVPHAFAPQAFLVFALLGATATQFIACCAWRPAFVAHGALSLGPLVARLLFERNLPAGFAALFAVAFGAILYSCCEKIARMIDTSSLLSHANAHLVDQLSREKTEAESARDSAQASARAKSVFIANISHEIRTPLNALLGMAQLLERSELDGAQRSHVRVVLDAGRGLKTLLDDVIALSRDEGEPYHDEDEDCDAAQAARTVARLLQPRAWEKQLTLSVTTAPNLPRVAADPRRVRQVLLKLTDNALKFTHRGCVNLSVDSGQDEGGRKTLRFAISDTGLGVPSEFAAELFKPFAAGTASYARQREGAGLGLAVAKRIIEELGGTIGFESETGEGSTFWFTVPAIGQAKADEHDAIPIAADAPPPWGLSLLVWSVDETVRTQIGNMLEPFGNNLAFAASVADAMALASRENFDAIIADAANVDLLASAPGVKTPTLALVLPGMRLPAAGGEVLRWPAAAGSLYASLRDLLGRMADAGSVPQDRTPQVAAAIDAPAFSALEKSLGLATLIEILQSYMTTADQLCGDLVHVSSREGWDDATRIAQDIAGAAGGLGLAALTVAARAFAQKARDGGGAGELQNAARHVLAEHERVRRALANLYPELAA